MKEPGNYIIKVEFGEKDITLLGNIVFESTINEKSQSEIIKKMLYELQAIDSRYREEHISGKRYLINPEG